MRRAICETPGAGERIGDFNAVGSAKAFDTWLERHELAGLAFEAVANVSWLIGEMDAGDGEATAIPCEKMMVLVTYCYAMGLYDSDEIARAVASDSILRDICAGMRPTAESVRQFRWAHNEVIIRALSQVLKRVEEKGRNDQ